MYTKMDHYYVRKYPPSLHLHPLYPDLGFLAPYSAEMGVESFGV